MSGGGSTNTVQKADPWSGVQPHLLSLYNKTGGALDNIFPMYPNQTYSNFNPMQEAAMAGNLDYAQNFYQPAAMGYQSSLANYMDAPMNIAGNPAVQSMMRANQQNATDWLTREALPAIGGGAVAAGQYGGSRHGLAQGQAIGDAAKALTQSNAQTMLGALDPMTRLAGFASTAMPGALQMGFTPGDLALQYGGAYQGMGQQGIDEAMQRYYYPETSLWDRLGTASNIFSGAGVYGGSSSSSSGPSNTLGNAIGLGSLGLGAYNSGLFGGAAGGLGAGMIGAGSAFGPLAFGTAAAPTAATFAGASAAPMLALMSDRRMKKNIIPIGEKDGYQWYEFEYKDEKYGKGKHVGVMADEVAEIKPEAVVVGENGYMMVNYGAL